MQDEQDEQVNHVAPKDLKRLDSGALGKPGRSPSVIVQLPQALLEHHEDAEQVAEEEDAAGC